MENFSFIYTTDGETLRLEGNRVIETEVASGNSAGRVWAAYYADIRKAYAERRDGVRVYETAHYDLVLMSGKRVKEGRKTGYSIINDFRPATPTKDGRLGCKVINYANFRKLLRYIGATRTRKAMAAKAGA